MTHIKVGDHVAYQGGDIGSYSTRRLMQAARLYPIPAGVSDEQAAAVMLKGMTVEYLLDRSVSLKAGDYALMNAAAGGVGLLAGQWAKARGIKMIGVAAGKDKCALALANGYHVVIDRNSEDILGPPSTSLLSASRHAAFSFLSEPLRERLRLSRPDCFKKRARSISRARHSSITARAPRITPCRQARCWAWSPAEP